MKTVQIDGDDDAPITKVTFLFWANNERKRVDILRARIIWGLVLILVASGTAIAVEGFGILNITQREAVYENSVNAQFYKNAKALAANQYEICYYAQTIADTIAKNEGALARIEAGAAAATTSAQRALSQKKAALWTQLAKQVAAVKRPKCDGLPALVPIKE